MLTGDGNVLTGERVGGARSGGVVVELCAGGLGDVELAVSHGVDRIELNSGMALGGLTPSAGLLREALAIFRGPLIAMARPREGGFLYSVNERLQMFRDVEWMWCYAASCGGYAGVQSLYFIRPLTGHRICLSHCGVWRIVGWIGC